MRFFESFILLLVVLAVALLIYLNWDSIAALFANFQQPQISDETTTEKTSSILLFLKGVINA